MPTETIRVSGLIPATPKRIYDAWFDTKEHSRFTGGKATIEPGVGKKFTAWNGYISGATLELEPNKRIVQSWRTTDFPEAAEESRLEVVLVSRLNGETEITFLHSNLPEGQGHKYEEGWVSQYLTPMRRYFTNQAAAAAKAKAAALAKPPAPPPAPKVKAAPAARPSAAAPASPAAKSTLRTKKSSTKTPAKKAPARKPVAKSKRVAVRKAKSRPVTKSALRKKSGKPKTTKGSTGKKTSKRR